MINRLVLLTLLATTNFAGERVTFDERPGERSVRPLLVALPSLETNDESLVEIRILRGRERVIQQTLAIPPGTPAGAVIDVLFTHPEELRQLRAEAPSLQFIVRANGRVIIDEPFAAIDARGRRLSAENALGDLREVKTYPKTVKRVASEARYRDQECVDNCDSQYNTCLQWCDPRGDSCTQCDTWYADCWTQCPVYCEEPANVTTYTVETPVTYTKYRSECWRNYNQWAGSGVWHDFYDVYTRVDSYQRTEHCDGSYTDTYTGTTYTNRTCIRKTNVNCGPSTGVTIGPYCP